MYEIVKETRETKQNMENDVTKEREANKNFFN